MKIMFQCLTLWLTMASCMAVSTTHKVKNEKMVLKPTELKADEQLLALNTMKDQAPPAARGAVQQILGPAVSLAAEGIKRLIVVDSKKYTAQYIAAANENQFYNQLSKGGSALDPNGIKFNGIEFSRHFADKDNKQKLALYLLLKVDQTGSASYNIINNSFFKLKLEEFKMPYFKCKVPQSRWFMPWTWFYKKDTAVNVDVVVSIRSSWMTREGVFYDKIEIGKFVTQFRDFPIDTTAQKKYIERKKKENGQLTGYCMLVPRTFGYFIDKDGTLTESYGQGLYSIVLDVRESSRGHLVNKMIEENAGMFIDTGTKSIKTNYKLQ